MAGTYCLDKMWEVLILKLEVHIITGVPYRFVRMPLASGPPSGRQELSNALKALFRVLLSLA